MLVRAMMVGIRTKEYKRENLGLGGHHLWEHEKGTHKKDMAKRGKGRKGKKVVIGCMGRREGKQ